VTPPGFVLPGIDVQKRVNRILSLMQYALVPDVTTSSLSITEAASGDPGLAFTQFGGGFTVSQIRYPHIKLESLDSTSSGVEGKALARSLGVWGRYRAPTGKTVFDRPLRYVLEVAGSNYYGDTRRCPRLRSPVVARCRHRVRYQQVRHDHRAHPLGPAPAHRPRRRRPVARHGRELLSMRACSLTPQHGQLTNRPGQAAAAHADEGTDKAVGYWACHRGLVAR
jgi:hypothetical protein